MKISGLEPTDGGNYRLLLSDGSQLVLSSAQAAKLLKYDSPELDPPRLEALKRQAEATRLRQRAGEMLGRRAMSKKELVRKLVEKGEDSEAAEAAAQWLEDRGYINEADYAAALVRRYSAKGYGASRIKNELYAHGIPRELWEDALCDLEDPSEEIDKFIFSRLRGQEADQKLIKKTTDALYRRGFSWDDIRSGLERYKDTL